MFLFWIHKNILHICIKQEEILRNNFYFIFNILCFISILNLESKHISSCFVNINLFITIEYIQLFLEDSLNFHINEMKKLHVSNHFKKETFLPSILQLSIFFIHYLRGKLLNNRVFVPNFGIACVSTILIVKTSFQISFESSCI